MRISDWSSDVCSSDLMPRTAPHRASRPRRRDHRARRGDGSRPAPARPAQEEEAEAARRDQLVRGPVAPRYHRLTRNGLNQNGLNQNGTPAAPEKWLAALLPSAASWHAAAMDRGPSSSNADGPPIRRAQVESLDVEAMLLADDAHAAFPGPGELGRAGGDHSPHK